MLINAQNLITIGGNVNSDYKLALRNNVPITAMAVTRKSATSYRLYDIYANPLAPLREMNGQRKHRNLSFRDMSNNNTTLKECKKFESTLDIDAQDIIANHLGQVSDAASQMGFRVVQHVDVQAARALLNGTTTHSQYIGPDSEAIFSTSHTMDPNRTQSNLLTSSLAAATFSEALATAKAFTDVEGMPAYIGYGTKPGVDKPILMVPTGLQAQAETIVGIGQVGLTAGPANLQNVNYGKADIIVNPYLDEEPNAWYLLFPAAGGALKPIAHYEFRPPEFVVKQNPEDPQVFENDVFSYGVLTQTHTLIVNWFQAIKANPDSNLYTGNTIKQGIGDAGLFQKV